MSLTAPQLLANMKANQISNEDRLSLAQLKRDLAYIRGWAGGDDSPFSSRYYGCTCADARCHIARIREYIESKYPHIVARKQAAACGMTEKQYIKAYCRGGRGSRGYTGARVDTGGRTHGQREGQAIRLTKASGSLGSGQRSIGGSK